MENRSYFRIRKCSEKEAVFRNVLEKAVRKKKRKSFSNTLRETMKGKDLSYETKRNDHENCIPDCGMLLRAGCCTDLHFPVYEWCSCHF